MEGHVARKEEGRGVFKILTDKPTEKRPLVRHRHGWDYIIKIDFGK